MRLNNGRSTDGTRHAGSKRPELRGRARRLRRREVRRRRRQRRQGGV